uniref:Uncharacterized protein n=1 Tax=Mustela putorius furo TaxID=9669 RepID=M3Z5P6_MUSPF
MVQGHRPGPREASPRAPNSDPSLRRSRDSETWEEHPRLPAGNSGERGLEPPSWPPEPVLRDHFAILGNWRHSHERPGSVQPSGASLRLPRPGVSWGRPHSHTAWLLLSPWLASAVGFAVRPAPQGHTSALSRCTSGSPAAVGLLKGGMCWMESQERGSGPWRDSVHRVPASPAGHHWASLHVAAAPTPSLPHSPSARNFLPSFLQTPPAGLCSVTSERPPSDIILQPSEQLWTEREDPADLPRPPACPVLTSSRNKTVSTQTPESPASGGGGQTFPAQAQAPGSPSSPPSTWGSVSSSGGVSPRPPCHPPPPRHASPPLSPQPASVGPFRPQRPRAVSFPATWSGLPCEPAERLPWQPLLRDLFLLLATLPPPSRPAAGLLFTCGQDSEGVGVD